MGFNREDLEKIIKEQFNMPSISLTIRKQIHKFVTELGLSYKEIAQALVFYVEVDKGQLDPKYGIGIVPYVIDRSKPYFARLKKEKEERLKSLENKKNEETIIFKPQPRERKRPKKIDIEDLEV
jgi:hypothetical protein